MLCWTWWLPVGSCGWKREVKCYLVCGKAEVMWYVRVCLSTWPGHPHYQSSEHVWRPTSSHCSSHDVKCPYSCCWHFRHLIAHSLLWSPYVIGQTVIFLLCDFYLSSFFPHLISAVGDWMSAILHTWCGLSVNLECMSEMCCTRLAENTGRKNRHFGTIAPLCWAVSSQLRHVLTIGKKLVKHRYLTHMSS